MLGGLSFLWFEALLARRDHLSYIIVTHPNIQYIFSHIMLHVQTASMYRFHDSACECPTRLEVISHARGRSNRSLMPIVPVSSLEKATEIVKLDSIFLKGPTTIIQATNFVEALSKVFELLQQGSTLVAYQKFVESWAVDVIHGAAGLKVGEQPRKRHQSIMQSAAWRLDRMISTSAVSNTIGRSWPSSEPVSTFMPSRKLRSAKKNQQSPAMVANTRSSARSLRWTPGQPKTSAFIWDELVPESPATFIPPMSTRQ